MKSLSRVRLPVTPWTAAHQAPPSMGVSRQEYWSGVPSPSPYKHDSDTNRMNTDVTCCIFPRQLGARYLLRTNTCKREIEVEMGRGRSRTMTESLTKPWPGNLGGNPGAGCHFLLQCRKVKSESEVAQSCPTLSDPKDCSLPGSSVHGIFQARVLEWGAIAFSVFSH